MTTREENQALLKKLEDMDFHQVMNIDSETEAMRVPGGLIYTRIIRTGASGFGTGVSNKAVTSTFVRLWE